MLRWEAAPARTRQSSRGDSQRQPGDSQRQPGCSQSHQPDFNPKFHEFDQPSRSDPLPPPEARRRCFILQLVGGYCVEQPAASRGDPRQPGGSQRQPGGSQRQLQKVLLLLKDFRVEKEAIDSFYQPSIHFISRGINYHDDDSEISIAIILETTISWVFGQRKH